MCQQIIVGSISNIARKEGYNQVFTLTTRKLVTKLYQSNATNAHNYCIAGFLLF